MKSRLQSAFTLIEMLVVISIIALLAALAVPAISSALTKGQLTGTMNNARQLYLAGQQMALDGTANSDPNLTFPGDDINAATLTLEQYVAKLVTNDYLKPGDVQKLLSAPGASCTVTPGDPTATPPTPMTLGGTSALKVYKITNADSANTIFAVTSNYVYDTALNSASNPYGDKGFIVQRKGGDAAILRKSNATVPAGGSQATFQSTVGKKPGAADGTVTAGDPPGGATMAFP
jgi:prepilin-type N-terminal cleavage/methylation domain-containing protein